MGTINIAGAAAYGGNTNSGITIVEQLIDFSDLDGNGTTAAQSDVIQAISVPANTWVMLMRAQVVRKEGAASTIDVGVTGVDPDGFFDGLNVNDDSVNVVSGPITLVEATPNTVAGYSGGLFFATAGTIDVLANNALDNAQVRLMAVMVDLNGTRKFDWGS